MAQRQGTRWHWHGGMAVALGTCVLLGCKSGRQQAQTQNGGVAASGESTASGASDSAPGTTSATTPRSPAPNASDAQVTASTLTVTDLENYEHGMQQQITAVKAARARLPQAHSGLDTLSVLAAMMPDSVESMAAHQLGVPVGHYREAIAVVDGLLNTRRDTHLSGNVAAKIDTANLPAEVKAQVRAGLAQTEKETRAADSAAESGLAPAVASALEQRRPKLDSLRTEYASQLTQTKQ